MVEAWDLRMTSMGPLIIFGPSIPPTSILSFVVLGATYHFLAPYFPAPKQAAWILTTISSFIMTLCSLPFLYDYLQHGGSVKDVRTFPALSIAANRFFQAYLVADLTFGSIYYRKYVSLLTGWIHHALYICVVELAVRQSWTHIFCLAAAMEIPTFVLGCASLFPRLRSNVLFALTFFVFRIAYHIILGISYVIPENRAQTTNGSFIPAAVLFFIFPLHALWFYNCLQGFARRLVERSHVISPAPPISLDIYSEVNPKATSILTERGRTSRISRRTNGDDNRRQLRRRREVLFEFVGLGRGSGRQDQ